MSRAKILYIGNLREGGNGRDRIAIFEQQGYSVEGFDTHAYRSAGSRLVRTMTARWQIGPVVSELNKTLTRRASEGEYDVVFIDKGTIIRAETLQSLKQGAEKKIAIHYTPDAAFADNRSQQFFKAIPAYDLLVTTKPFERAEYERAGARDLLLVHQGYGPRIDLSLSDVPDEYRSEVAFIGHCQPHYARTLKVVAESAPLAIRGPGWPEYAARHQWARKVVKGGGLYGSDYARAILGAKMAIGLLSKRVPETTTTRSFEIPAMGTMLLAERTDDHMALFEEGTEAEFFDSDDEMVAKLKKYLCDDKARERIAAAGQLKCREAQYSTAEQFALIVKWIDQTIASSRLSNGTSLK